MAKRKVSGEGGPKLPTTGEGRAARYEALRAEERAIAERKAKKKRVTSTGRVGGGGVVKPGRSRKALFGMRVTQRQLNAIHGQASVRSGYAPDAATWNASEYIRALVALDGIGAVNWNRLTELIGHAPESDDDGDNEGEE